MSMISICLSQEVQHKVLKYFQLKPKVNSLRQVYEVSELIHCTKYCK